MPTGVCSCLQVHSHLQRFVTSAYDEFGLNRGLNFVMRFNMWSERMRLLKTVRIHQSFITITPAIDIILFSPPDRLWEGLSKAELLFSPAAVPP